MATERRSYFCPLCNYEQRTDFETCPTCGINTITGEQERKNKYRLMTKKEGRKKCA